MAAGVEPIVVVLTALDLEYQAVLAHLSDPAEVAHPAGTLFEVGRLPGSPGFVALAVTTVGNNATATLAERAIALFQPEAVFFIGVAGALHDNLNIGDVVVATRVYALHGGRVDGVSLHARPQAWNAPHELDQRARAINRARSWTRLLPPSTTVPTVWFAPIAAGEVVLDSRSTPMWQWLREHFNDAVAIEMEGAGVALAGHLNRSVPVLVVRGISDLADGQKAWADRGGAQPMAASHAAAFGLAVAAAVLDRDGSAEPVQLGHIAPLPIDTGRPNRMIATAREVVAADQQVLLVHTLTGLRVHVAIVAGDLFSWPQEDLVIGFTDTFDTSTEDDIIIASDSAQGQLLARIYRHDVERLDRDLDRSLAEVEPLLYERRADKPLGKLVRYPVGTVAVLREGRRSIFCLAYSRMGNNLVAQSSLSWVQHSLDRLWQAVHRHGQFSDVNMPLVGSSRSRIREADHQDLLVSTMKSFVDASRAFPVCRTLRIVLHPHHVHKVDIAAVGEMLKRW
nr:macro domain-containing protein [Allorhizocola rhizosphaerae]